MGGHRLVGQPVLQVFGQGPHRQIAILRLRRHRLQTDGLQRRRDLTADRARPNEAAAADLLQHSGDVVRFQRRATGEQRVKDRAQAVDVGGRPEPVSLSRGLLGAHVGRGPQDPAGARQPRRLSGREIHDCCVVGGDLCRMSLDLGQPPIQYEGLSEIAEHDVVRLQVAVQDAASVRIVDRVAHVDEMPQQLAQLQNALAATIRGMAGTIAPMVAPGVVLLVEVGDRLLERLAADEPHHVVRPSVRVLAQRMDRHHPGVLQRARDLGLGNEARAAFRVAGTMDQQFLERHLAVQVLIDRDRHLPQPPLGVRTHYAKPQLTRTALSRVRHGRVRDSALAVGHVVPRSFCVVARGLDRLVVVRVRHNGTSSASPYVTTYSGT